MSTMTGVTAQVDIVSGAHVQTQEIHFAPQNIAVEVGVNNTITWVNQDTVAHTVTSNTNAFASGTISPGSNFTMTFTVPGIYPYHCSIHPFMTGTVIVLNSSGQMVSQTVTSSSVATQSSTSTSCSYYNGYCY